MLPSRTTRHSAPRAATPLVAALPVAALLVAGLTVAGLPPRVVGAQAASPTPPRTYAACYVPSTGTVYRIDKPQGSTPGAPAACGTNRKGVADVEFSWTDGDGALRVSDAAGGDVAGTFGSLTVARLLGRALATTPPADGQVLVWDAGSSSWAARTPAAGGVSVHGQLQGLGNDDHPQYLLGNGTRNSPNGFAVTGTAGLGTLAASGPGTRLVWHPGKAAFRAGGVTGAQWDDANIGRYSAALGYNTTASGTSSTALGSATTASAVFSTALGADATASANYATAIGQRVTASAANAMALGSGSSATGGGAVAIGNNAAANGLLATAIGASATAAANYSTAIGQNVTASGTTALALGNYAWATGSESVAIGSYVSTNDQRGAFVIGDPSSGQALNASAPNQFSARFAGGYRLYSNNVLTVGVTLAPGSGSWQSVSDVRKKTAFRPVDGEQLLAKLAAMPVQTWQYRAQDAGVRHIGPTAQDFRRAFGVGESDTTITTVDADGVALAAARALEARTRLLQAENAAMRAELAALRRTVLALRDGPRTNQVARRTVTGATSPARRAVRTR
jgi:hypothetical protein